MARLTRAPVLALALLGAGAAFAGSYQQQAERLATLRAEVEALSTELTAEVDEARGRLRAVEAQKVELEVQIRRQELRLERLITEEANQRAAIAEAGDGNPDVRAAVMDGIGVLRAALGESLPFKLDQRQAGLDELEKQLKDDTLSAEQAAARLWAFAEDERRLTRENALDRQVVTLAGEEVLVDVARIGMVAMYWRSPDGQVGRAVRSGADWRYESLSGASADQVRDLFVAMEKGIRSGFFTLPGLTAEVAQ